MNSASKFRDSISRINLPNNLGPDLKVNAGERAILVRLPAVSCDLGRPATLRVAPRVYKLPRPPTSLSDTLYATNVHTRYT